MDLSLEETVGGLQSAVIADRQEVSIRKDRRHYTALLARVREPPESLQDCDPPVLGFLEPLVNKELCRELVRVKGQRPRLQEVCQQSTRGLASPECAVVARVDFPPPADVWSSEPTGQET